MIQRKTEKSLRNEVSDHWSWLERYNMMEQSRFLKACQGKPVDRIPVWIMRQAGRYQPEYRRLREKVPFLTLCKTPELAVEATLQPIKRFQMDAAILFSDILLILEAMGTELTFEADHGPRIGRRENLDEMVRGLIIPDPEEKVPVIHYSLGASTLLKKMNRMNADVMGVDWKIDIVEARKVLGRSRSVQGNMDPFALFQPTDKLKATVGELLKKGSKWPGYIFNLGHGIDQKTPVENVYHMVDAIRKFDPSATQFPRPVPRICQNLPSSEVIHFSRK